ncbi:hypothetical protein BC829DRAFT_359394, partial [Chytridium lagenaria]
IGPNSLPSLQLRYWRGVSDVLQELGCEVYMPAGGLDTRYLICHLPSPHFHINSLTTIATPHRGSTFMDWCRDTLGLGYHFHHDDADPVSRELRKGEREGKRNQDVASSEWKVMVQSAAGAHPLVRALSSKLDAPAFSNLTTDFCNVFNGVTPNVSTVHYSSYAAVREVSKLAPLYLPHVIIKKSEGWNDGLVSLASARWGDFQGIVACDHWELVPAQSSWPRVFRGCSYGTIRSRLTFSCRSV